jgi:hypothetical protein
VKKTTHLKNLIDNLPTEQTRPTPGLELVALSRPDSMHNMAIGKNTSALNPMIIMKIGTPHMQREDYS